jgi:Prealbumin-like fold domain
MRSTNRKLAIVSLLALVGSTLAVVPGLKATAAVNGALPAMSCGPNNVDPNAISCAGFYAGNSTFSGRTTAYYATQNNPAANPANRQAGRTPYFAGLFDTSQGLGWCILDSGAPALFTGGSSVGFSPADGPAAAAAQLVMAATADGRWIWNPSDGAIFDVHQRAAIGAALAHVAAKDLAASGSGFQTVYMTSIEYNFPLAGLMGYVPAAARELYSITSAHPGPWSVSVSGGGAVQAGQSWSAAATVVDSNGAPVPFVLVDLDWSGSSSGTVSSRNGSVSTSVLSPSTGSGAISFAGSSARPDLNFEKIVGLSSSFNSAQDLFKLKPSITTSGSAAGTSTAPLSRVSFTKLVDGAPGPAGVVFEVLNGDGSSTGVTRTTQANGLTIGVDLPPGSYLLREVSVPAGSGLLLNTATVAFSVGNAGGSFSVSFTDLREPSVVTQVRNPSLVAGPSSDLTDTLTFGGSPGARVVGVINLYAVPKGTPKVCDASSLVAGPFVTADTVLSASGATVDIEVTHATDASFDYFFDERVDSTTPFNLSTGVTSCALPNETFAVRPVLASTVVSGGSGVDNSTFGPFGIGVKTFSVTDKVSLPDVPDSGATVDLSVYASSGPESCSGLALSPVQRLAFDAAGSQSATFALPTDLPAGSYGVREVVMTGATVVTDRCAHVAVASGSLPASAERFSVQALPLVSTATSGGAGVDSSTFGPFGLGVKDFTVNDTVTLASVPAAGVTVDLSVFASSGPEVCSGDALSPVVTLAFAAAGVQTASLALPTTLPVGGYGVREIVKMGDTVLADRCAHVAVASGSQLASAERFMVNPPPVVATQAAGGSGVMAHDFTTSENISFSVTDTIVISSVTSDTLVTLSVHKMTGDVCTEAAVGTPVELAFSKDGKDFARFTMPRSLEAGTYGIREVVKLKDGTVLADRCGFMDATSFERFTYSGQSNGGTTPPLKRLPVTT